MIDHLFFRLAAASLEQTLDVLRRDGLSFDRQAIAQTEKERCDGFYGLGIGPLMDTIEQWKILLLEMPGDRFIGGDHEFLYDPVGNVALGPHYIFRRSLDVEDNFRLREIEIQVPSASATLVNQ